MINNQGEAGGRHENSDNLLRLIEGLNRVHQSLSQPPEELDGIRYDPDEKILMEPVQGFPSKVPVVPRPTFMDSPEKTPGPRSGDVDTIAWQPPWAKQFGRQRPTRTSRQSNERFRLTRWVAPGAVGGVLLAFAAVATGLVDSGSGAHHAAEAPKPTTIKPAVPRKPSATTPEATGGTIQKKAAKGEASTSPAQIPPAPSTTTPEVPPPLPIPENHHQISRINHIKHKRGCVGQLRPKGSVNCGAPVAKPQSPAGS